MRPLSEEETKAVFEKLHKFIGAPRRLPWAHAWGAGRCARRRRVPGARCLLPLPVQTEAQHTTLFGPQRTTLFWASCKPVRKPARDLLASQLACAPALFTVVQHMAL